ncbi:hypothetical protein [Amycolatopsis eburnea]|uniref:Uncharacterized protein n=1 Tax=Amycolatopsis eburnea TaxID=2267691 RepID=A0A427TGI9_9PSEU|nr:hypothetical protein [Amycolatopsis eburnea]RSD21986.1 hypothetical protein EIY87_09215 [Amycolatopsis eburnea]
MTGREELVELLKAADTARWGGPQVTFEGMDVPYDHFADAILAAGWRPTTRCVNDANGDGDCAACARNPDAPCRQPFAPLPDSETEGPSPWDAYVKAFREYQETDPHGAAAHPTAHHMHALEAALRVATSPPPAPRVFLPGDTVPAGMAVVNHVGGVWRHHADRVVKTGYALEIFLPSPEERDHVAAAAIRARDEGKEQQP